jgi:hypothetical protein
MRWRLTKLWKIPLVRGDTQAVKIEITASIAELFRVSTLWATGCERRSLPAGSDCGEAPSPG